MGDYDLTLGPLLIGIIFNTFLFGLVTAQFVTYHRAGYKDSPLLRWMVIFLFVLDAFHSGALIWMAWEYCITGYGKPETLMIGLWPYTFTPIANSVASLLIQFFLAWRVYTLSKSIWLYAVIICLAVPASALGITSGTKAWIIKYLAEMSRLNTLCTVWLVQQVIADLFVTGTLGFLLARSKTGTKKMDTVLNRLIRGAIQTGLFAGIFSILDLLTFLRWPATNLYGMFAVPIGRIYTNTLLDTLNARTELRDHLSGTREFAFGGITTALKWSLKRPTQMTQQTTDTAQEISGTSEEDEQKDVMVLVEDGRAGGPHLEGSGSKGKERWTEQ